MVINADRDGSETGLTQNLAANIWKQGKKKRKKKKKKSLEKC